MKFQKIFSLFLILINFTYTQEYLKKFEKIKLPPIYPKKAISPQIDNAKKFGNIDQYQLLNNYMKIKISFVQIKKIEKISINRIFYFSNNCTVYETKKYIRDTFAFKGSLYSEVERKKAFHFIELQNNELLKNLKIHSSGIREAKFILSN